MTILIKGMKMPPSDKALIMAYKDGRFIWIDLEGEKTYQYEAVEVPTPHGRLIEVEALERMDFSNWIMQGDVGYVPFMEVAAAIFKAPTVIEAEEG